MFQRAIIVNASPSGASTGAQRMLANLLPSTRGGVEHEFLNPTVKEYGTAKTSKFIRIFRFQSTTLI